MLNYFNSLSVEEAMEALETMEAREGYEVRRTMATMLLLWPTTHTQAHTNKQTSKHKHTNDSILLLRMSGSKRPIVWKLKTLN